MARTPIVAGNWKMNTLRDEALTLVRAVRENADAITGVEKIVCPPFIFLHDVKQALAGSTIAVGAQNAYWEEKGAFTGEVSITQVAETATHVILGHSERRQYFSETDETVNRRVRAALAHGVTPIMCVGETLQQREAGETAAVLVRQTRGGLAGVGIVPELIVAYEPVWAIGTGLAADGAIAQEAIALIRNTMRDLAGTVADSIRILYGGSVTPDNVAEYMSQADVDGGLIGGASLKAESYTALVRGVADAAHRA
jgi:triosephosphate isomerase